MSTRKQIRDSIASALSTHSPALSVFSGKHITDITDVMPAVSVYLDNGVMEHDLQGNAIVSASIQLMFITDGTASGDDTVDAVADPAIAAVFDDATVRASVMHALYESFAYERDEWAPYTAFVANISVKYVF